MTPDEKRAFFDKYVGAFASEREKFLALHTQLAQLHPEWIGQQDARTNLVAKPVNFLLTTIVNLRLLQHTVGDMQFWTVAVNATMDEPKNVEAAAFELITFYRVATLVFLFSAVEHGIRAILRGVSPTAPTEGAYYGVYMRLLKQDAQVAQADDHVNLLDFLRTLRNTIHNNGVYLPVNGKDRDFTIGGKKYEFRVGKRAEFFGWDTLLDILDPLRKLMRDLLEAPEVACLSSIEDVASHS